MRARVGSPRRRNSSASPGRLLRRNQPGAGGADPLGIDNLHGAGVEPDDLLSHAHLLISPLIHT